MKLRNFLLIALFLSAYPAFGNTEILIFDTKETGKDGLPRNFRDLSSLGINAIASGQFSEDELLAVRKKFPNEKIIIVDLRRESHGFIDGNSVSWRAAFEKSNENKTAAQIIAYEKSLLRTEKKQRQIIINKILEKNPESSWYKQVEPEIVSVNKIINEEDLAKKHGFQYKRFVVQDHAKPSDSELTRIISFIRSLPQEQKVYVHCAAGKGRTTTFLTLFDIIKNGKNTQLKTIFKRQSKLGGATLDEIDEKSEWRTKLSEERLKMIEDFYKIETSK